MSLEALFSVYQEAGHADYIGEPVSQLEHMQQAAWLARQAGADDGLILGAFFHDIGHLVAPDGAPQMEDLGVLNHEQVGAERLRECGFSGRVADLVELHVQAKRYLCFSRTGYAQKLSAASRGTLAFQGGAMSAEEAKEFEQHPLFEDILRLRAWDEAAKVANGQGMELAELRSIAEKTQKRDMLTEKDRLSWERQGVLHLPDFFPAVELQQWTEEMMLWPETPGRWMKYFEEIQGVRELCRVENFLHYHAGWRSVIEHAGMGAVLESLFGEPSLLFKEKINFKLPGGSGFGAHQDAPAFATFGQQFHITAMVSIDATTCANGCLEVAYGRHQEGLLGMTEAQVLTDDVVSELDWVPL